MANNQDNNQFGFDFNDFFSNKSNRSFERDVHTIAEMFRRNGGYFGDGGRRAPTQSQSNYTDSNSKWEFRRESRSRRNNRNYRRYGSSVLDEFESGVQEQLLDALSGGDFRKGIESALSQFVDEFGFEFQDLPREYGKQLTKEIVNKIGDIQIGDENTVRDIVRDKISGFTDSVLNTISDKFGSQFGDSLKNIFDSFKKGSESGRQGSADSESPASSFDINKLHDIDNNPVGENVPSESPMSSEPLDIGGDVATESDIIPASGTPDTLPMTEALSSDTVGVVAEGAGEAAIGTEVASSGMAVAEGAEVGGALATGAEGVGVAGTAVAGSGMTALAATGWGLLIIGIIITIVEVLGPALKGLAEIAKSLGNSWSRDEKAYKRRTENAQKRLEADMQWMAEKPFQILEDAVKRWEDAWDANLRKIGQTQGYDKESVYELYENYAERLRQDNLDSVINATDIVDKLTSVLETGLSGQVAEEFSYIATKLNAAIPTQDFFGYAETYASIAANAISQGASQREALDYANEQLEQFASNLLYSSRELAGGFSTGLKSSSELFKDAVQIAQSARDYDALGDISGTLTSVSAIIGSVAPDLASSLVSNVVQAAIGGNDNTIVALRSLAGINAGNTEFLQEMADNPQKVFSQLFNKLAELQNMSPANYMEVAEGLAGVFGIDKAAFARVDFNYLAKAIDNMEVNDASLNENLKLLQSGQTTTSAEQLKAQEINRVILDEGLAYVIDSEAGRMVQEHMWAEQRANALMENEFAVNLQGSALSFLEGIRESFTTLLNFLNPVGYVAKGIANMTQTIVEAIGNEEDIKEALKLTAVGENRVAYNNLTTRGKDLKLTSSFIEMLGGKKGTILNDITSVNRNLSNLTNFMLTGGIPTADSFNQFNDFVSSGGLTRMYDGVSNTVKDISNTVKSISQGYTDYSVSSRYDWGMVGKSFAQALSNTPTNPISAVANVANAVVDATKQSIEESNQRFQEFLNSLSDLSDGISYADWQKADTDLGYSEWANEQLSGGNKLVSFDDLGSMAENFGIADLTDALFNFNKSEDDLRTYFESQEARQGAIISEGRLQDEEKFRTENRGFWRYSDGVSGVFYNAIWYPFFGKDQLYETRMDAVDLALFNIQEKLGNNSKHTVISGIEEISSRIGESRNYTVISVLEKIESHINDTFVKSESSFQQCLADWVEYIADSKTYTEEVSRSSAWSDLQSAEKDQQAESTLALANALGVFSAEELKKLDPQLQTNVLLGEIVVILQTIMQQTNTPGGLNLIDTISALGLGMTTKTV